MHLFDRVGIICDRHFAESALALRAMLESMRLQVDLVRVVQDRNVRAFFRDHAGSYDYTVIWTHGFGPDDDPVIGFDVVSQETGDYDRSDGWSPIRLDLGQHTAAEWIDGRGRGTLVTLSCGSGRTVLSSALLGQGYHTHIGPGTAYYASDAGQLFAFAYFYALLSNDRDYARPMSEREAFELAAQIDPTNPYGPSVMRRRSTVDA